ncbi:hypothetical protein WKH71_05235 [Pantoea agglomerans]|uniref:hypothetical protein n=1 Tax=Enterobacter agglomerans TaxID=549 RepID=UPI003C7BE5C1
MKMNIVFEIPSTLPIESPEKVWELQCKLDALAQELYGERNHLITLDPPKFTDDPKAPQVAFSKGGAYAELNNDAAQDWSYCIYQLSHETIHLLDPRPIPPFGKGANYLEEGVAVEFSLQVSNAIAPEIMSIGDDTGSLKYIEAKKRLMKIGIKDFHEKLKKLRLNAGHFADVSSDLVAAITPQCRGKNAAQLTESFYS